MEKRKGTRKKEGEKIKHPKNKWGKNQNPLLWFIYLQYSEMYSNHIGLSCQFLISCTLTYLWFIVKNGCLEIHQSLVQIIVLILDGELY